MVTSPGCLRAASRDCAKTRETRVRGQPLGRGPAAQERAALQEQPRKGESTRATFKVNPRSQG